MDFDKKDLSGAALDRALLDGYDLDEFDFTKARLNYASLVGVRAKSSKFIQAEMSSADFSEALLEYASFRSAFANFAIFDRAKLANADFSFSFICKSSFWNADMRRTNLTGATATFAVVRYSNLSWADMTGSNFTSAILSGSDLSFALLDSATMRKAEMAYSTFRGASARNADMTEVRAFDADFRKANLSGANLQGADLTRANLSGANLQDADLRGAVLDDAILDGAVLVNAKLDRVSARRASVRVVDMSSLKHLSEIDRSRVKTGEEKMRKIKIGMVFQARSLEEIIAGIEEVLIVQHGIMPVRPESKLEQRDYYLFLLEKINDLLPGDLYFGTPPWGDPETYGYWEKPF